MRNFLYILVVLASFLACSCAKKEHSELFNDYQFIDIDLVMYVNDEEGKNLLDSESKPSYADSVITATYLKHEYKLNDGPDNRGIVFSVYKDYTGKIEALSFGPIPGNMSVENEPLTVNIGKNKFTMEITNKYIYSIDNEPILEKHIMYNGKDYYTGMSFVPLVIPSKK